MKDTASQCMVVAALIATIVFAAAFTVPGGYDQNDGIPIFFENEAFIIFVVADAISLFSSSASILMFLSILTSRYAERDFQESLPKKLMVGLATLFLSITTMMIAFSVSFFVLYHNKLKWIPILITFFSALPVILYAMLQFSLLKDVFFSTYTSRYLFRPKKHILYDENCKPNRRRFPFTIPFISRCTTKISKPLLLLLADAEMSQKGLPLPNSNVQNPTSQQQQHATGVSFAPQDLPIPAYPVNTDHKKAADVPVPQYPSIPHPFTDHNKATDVPVPQYPSIPHPFMDHNKAADVPVPQYPVPQYPSIPHPFTDHNRAGDVPVPQYPPQYPSTPHPFTGFPLPNFDVKNPPSQQQQHVVGVSFAPQEKAIPDLFNGPRIDYIHFGVPLYEASIKGDWKAAKEIFDETPALVRYSITENGETALHVAASAERTNEVEEFVEHLVNYMQKKDLELQDKSSNTALCVVAASGKINMVKIMVQKNRDLMSIRGWQNMMPLYMAALFGHHEVVKYLYQESNNLRDESYWTPKTRGWLLLTCVENDMFDVALWIVKDHPELVNSSDVLGVLAQKPDAFSKRKSNIIMNTVKWVFTVIFPKVGVYEKGSTALELLTIMWQNIAMKSKKEIDVILRGTPVTLPGNAKKKYSSQIPFVAAERGNTRFVIELIRLYPDLIWKVNDTNQSIFHTAAEHRHMDIYNLLYEIGSKRNQITLLKDANENNMLHLVGKSAKKKRHEDVSGAAFEMQRELLWFKEVEGMVPFSYREERNKDGLTPHELFTVEHKDLVVKGEEWMKGTASQCMVVAALIATIVFAAAFTVPGGYNQNDGIPIFYREVSLKLFVVADAISLFSSSASIIMFLSILTSRYGERDFYESLPKKLTLGLATLFLSITTMMVAFSLSLFVLYHKDLKWIPILVAMFATMPVFLFATLQYPLLKDIILATYGSKYLFRPKKRVLYENHQRFAIPMPF
ncbi:unnamed protein product [Lactuca saligna]|uniref:PGG domain-containing protein n=1 Tax=Lactuca saligna TaxID=75948 RepID=A0AA35VIC2_LACSI|nr:unnamed protein product [Lactuca saligna]